MSGVRGSALRKPVTKKSRGGSRFTTGLFTALSCLGDYLRYSPGLYRNFEQQASAEIQTRSMEGAIFSPHTGEKNLDANEHGDYLSKEIHEKACN